MKKLIAGGVAAVLALGLSAAVVAPAQAAPWHHHHHYHGGYWGPGPAIGAGILGFAAGAAIAGAAESSHRDHVDACFAAYRSYDPRSDTYLGYDGYRHRCRL
jgi:hypothetical protein